MELQTKASRKSLREHNQTLVFQTIYNCRSTTRVEVAEKTELTRTTVAAVVDDLIKNHLVEDTGKPRTSRERTPSLGRIPTSIRVLKDGRHIIAVDVSHEELTGALINLRGDIKDRIITQLDKQDEANIQDQILDFINNLKRASKRTKLLGIGLSMTGVVNSDTGVLLVANRLRGLSNIRFRDILKGQHDSLPVYVMNNGQALVLGEYSKMEGEPPVTNLIAIRTGSGIGGGLILDGKVFHGDGYGAGEFGKNVVECYRGNYRNLSSVAIDEAIIERAKKYASKDPASTLDEKLSSKIEHEVAFKHIADAARNGDTVAKDTIEEIGRYFGRAIGYMVNILNIQHIIVSGKISVFGDRLRDEMVKEMERFSEMALASHTKIQIVPSDVDKYLIGAATPLLTHEFGIPRFVPDRS